SCRLQVYGATDPAVAGPPSVAREAERLAAELRTRAEGSADEPALRARLAAAPDDVDARLRLGRARRARGLRRRARRAARGGAPRPRLRRRRDAQGDARRLQAAGPRPSPDGAVPERAGAGPAPVA